MGGPSSSTRAKSTIRILMGTVTLAIATTILAHPQPVASVVDSGADHPTSVGVGTGAIAAATVSPTSNDGARAIAEADAYTLAASSKLASWTGWVDLYRGDAFTKQATLRWCVAASTQMMRNLVAGESDHAAASQAQFFAYGRANNGYATPAIDGIDPAGWLALLRRYVDPSYQIVAARSYRTALNAAATALRLTGKPVGVFVHHAAHVWVMSGFTATADPASGASFTVTSVNVEAPLWGWTTHHIHDPAPDSQLSAAAFSTFLTSYHDRFEPDGWPGRYVILVPVAS